MATVTEEIVVGILSDAIEMGINVSIKKSGFTVGQIFRFMMKRPDLMQLLVANQSLRAEINADECVDIADNEFDVDRAKLRIAARQWFASRILHRKYGDKVSVDVTQKVDLRAAIEAGKERARQVLNAGAAEKVEKLAVPELIEGGEIKGLNPVNPPDDLVKWGEELVATLPEECRPIDSFEE